MSHLKFQKTLLASCTALVTVQAVAQDDAVVQEEVVVTGMRASLESSINVKQSSQHVVEALDLSDIDANLM